MGTTGRAAWCSVALLVLVVGCSESPESDDVGWRESFTESFSYARAGEMAARWVSLSSPQWGQPFSEPFADSGGWRVQDSSLVGYAHGGYYNITCLDTFPGDLRVEWDVTPLRRNLNLNCYIAGGDRSSGYTFHIAGYDDPRTVVLTKGAMFTQLDNHRLPEPIELGKTYRVRMEKAGQNIRLWINGRRVFDFRDHDEISGPGHQTFGFENNSGNSLRLDNITAYERSTAGLSSAQASAEAAYQSGDYRTAREHYLSIPQDAGLDERARARYRAARCLEMLDSVDAALRAYEALEQEFGTHELCALSAGQRGAIYDRLGDTASAGRTYRELARRFPGHAVLRTVYFNMGNAIAGRRVELVDGLLRDSAYDGSTGRALYELALKLRRTGIEFGVSLSSVAALERLLEDLLYNEVLSVDTAIRYFPEQRSAIARALLAYGQLERVVDEYPDISSELGLALVAMGRYSEALRKAPSSRSACASALLTLGRYDELLAKYTDVRVQRAEALRRAGRFDELFGGYSDVFEVCRIAATETGRLATYFASVSPDYHSIAQALMSIANKPEIVLLALEGAQTTLTFRDNLLANEALRVLGRGEEANERYRRSFMMEIPLGHNMCMMGQPQRAIATYPTMGDVLVRAWREMALFDSTMARFPDRRWAMFDAMACQARTDDILKAYSRNDSLKALALMLAGRYDDVLGGSRENRGLRADALLALGRYQEVLRRYPDQRRACGKALLSVVGVDSAIGRYPECAIDCAEQLLSEQHWSSVIQHFANLPHQYGQALIEVGRYAEVPVRSGRILVEPAQAYDLAARRALREWTLGNHAAADSVLAGAQDRFMYMWAQHRFSRYLLLPVLQALDGNVDALRPGCQLAMSQTASLFGRRVWFEAAYLGGFIDSTQFLAQPFAQNARARLELFDAIRADISRQVVDAARGYESWLGRYVWVNVPEGFVDLEHSSAMRRFVQWRLSVLAGKLASVQE